MGFSAEKFSDSGTEETSSNGSSSLTSGDGAAKSTNSSLQSLVCRPPRNPGAVTQRCGSDSGKVVSELDNNNKSSKISEMDMMKERFAKLLLGEDMSGCGKGDLLASSLSFWLVFSGSRCIENELIPITGFDPSDGIWAIVETRAIVFGEKIDVAKGDGVAAQCWRSYCGVDTIMANISRWEQARALRKLDNMLLVSCNNTPFPVLLNFVSFILIKKKLTFLLSQEILNSFNGMEFWYVDQGIVASDRNGSASFRKTLQRQEEKWWLPVPRVPAGGLQENSRKELDHKRECTNQILKAAMAINSHVLAEMEVPDSYLESLPKNGRACLGDMIYRYITSDRFSPECLLDCLDLSSEHVALEIANHVEAAVYVWRRRVHAKAATNPNRSTTKSSWEMVRDLMVDGDKREQLAERAERLLLCLQQRCPGLTQTTLDATKIQCNKDVGKSILESYSRVLESLAFNIVARIDDVLYVDDLNKCSEKMSSVPTVSIMTHKKMSMPSYAMLVSGTPYKATLASSSFTPSTLGSPARAKRTPFIPRDKPPRGGMGVKRVLSNYLANEVRMKDGSRNQIEGPASISKTNKESSASRADAENIDPQRVSSATRKSVSRLR
ncbi:Rop guanine nucleotide exchange factor 5-like protein [Drosera capensis]